MTNYSIELKKKLAKTMAEVDVECLGSDYQDAYEHNLLMDSFELLEFWLDYFGVFEESNGKLLEDMLIFKKEN